MLFRRIRHPVLKSRREVATFDKDKAPVPVGLIGETDLGIRSPPGVLLVQATHHLPGQPLDLAIGPFEKLQHLRMGVRATVANGHPRKLVIDG